MNASGAKDRIARAHVHCTCTRPSLQGGVLNSQAAAGRSHTEHVVHAHIHLVRGVS